MRAKHLVDKQLELSKTEKDLKDTYNRVQYLEHFETDYYTMKDKYDNLISFLSDYLLNKTNNTYIEENTIREQITSLLVANTELIDNVSIENGYITSVIRTGTLIRPTDIPEDIKNGYWILEDGKYKLDEEQFKKLWSVI